MESALTNASEVTQGSWAFGMTQVSPEPALRSWSLLLNQRNMVALRGLPPSTVVFNFLNIYFIFGCAGSSLLCVAFSSCREGSALCWVCRLLTVVASLVEERGPYICRLQRLQRLLSAGSAVVANEFSCLKVMQNLHRPGMQPTCIARQVLNRWTASEASPPTLNRALFVCFSYAWLLSGLFVGR